MKHYEILPIENDTTTALDTMYKVADILNLTTKEMLGLLGFDSMYALREYAFNNPREHFKFQTFMMNRLNDICKDADAPIRIGRAPAILRSKL